VELQRDRPAAVISSLALDALPVRTVVPLTTWRDRYEGRLNKLRVAASDWNELHPESAADVVQVRSLSTERSLSRIGALEADEVEEIAAGVAIAVDYIG